MDGKLFKNQNQQLNTTASFNFKACFDPIDTMNAVSIDWLHSAHPQVMLYTEMGFET